MVASSDDYDPLAVFTRPPPNETPGERAARERAEAEAKKRSDAIDEELRREKARMKKEEKDLVRVLLLGQSESGKSTTLKNFRMKYAREEWDAELAGWRSVIQLNLLKSVITMLDALQAEQDNGPLLDSRPATPAAGASAEFLVAPPLTPGVRSNSGANLRQELVRASTSTTVAAPTATLSGKHQLLKLRLAPLRRVEQDLRRRLGAVAEEVTAEAAAVGWGPLGNITNNNDNGAGGSSEPAKRTTTREFGVRRLKDALTTLQAQASSSSSSSSSSQHRSQGHSARKDSEDSRVDESTEVIASCHDDIKSLWTDDTLRVILKKRKIRLEDSAGFFLEDLDRIAARDYTPSDDDVVRARLRTVGVQEYRIRFEQATGVGSSLANFGTDWLLYDVGGSRTSRNAWIPYFDNIHALIFLAPLSCFDERLLEDSRVNRLEDSFLLWRTVCASRLLKKASLILFMNKCDLLKRKLRMGIKVKNYLPSFGERANDAPMVVKYLKEKFKDLNKRHSVELTRMVYYYATSVTDTKTTAITLVAVKDIILRDHLKSADFV